MSYRDKPRSLVDILSVHAAGGKSIVFTRTKAGADEVAAAVNQSQLCEALHGDIPQAQREKTLKRFRDGDFNVLVATDVAARGLDIPSVELVVHYDIPQVRVAAECYQLTMAHSTRCCGMSVGGDQTN